MCAFYQAGSLAFRECAQHSVRRTAGSLHVFEQFSWLEVDSVKMALSRPVHQRVPITCSVKGLENKRWTLLFRECFAIPISIFLFAVGFNAISVVEIEASRSVQVQPSARVLLLSMQFSLELCHAQIV
jgi:hypothetical protein